MRLQISAGALILLAMYLLLLPLPWVAAAILAGTVHELFHLAAITALGGSVTEILISGRGAAMRTEPLSPIRELLSALAGPVGSLSLILFCRWIPRTAICGAIHALFNLLPLFPLDGGRILRCILFFVLTPPKAERVFSGIQHMIPLSIVILAVVFAGKLGIFLLMLLFFLLPRYLFAGTIRILSHKRYGYDRIIKTHSAYRAETGPVYRRGIQRD